MVPAWCVYTAVVTSTAAAATVAAAAEAIAADPASAVVLQKEVVMGGICQRSRQRTNAYPGTHIYLVNRTAVGALLLRSAVVQV